MMIIKSFLMVILLKRLSAISTSEVEGSQASAGACCDMDAGVEFNSLYISSDCEYDKDAVESDCSINGPAYVTENLDSTGVSLTGTASTGPSHSNSILTISESLSELVVLIKKAWPIALESINIPRGSVNYYYAIDSKKSDLKRLIIDKFNSNSEIRTARVCRAVRIFRNIGCNRSSLAEIAELKQIAIDFMSEMMTLCIEVGIHPNTLSEVRRKKMIKLSIFGENSGYLDVYSTGIAEEFDENCGLDSGAGSSGSFDLRAALDFRITSTSATTSTPIADNVVLPVLSDPSPSLSTGYATPDSCSASVSLATSTPLASQLPSVVTNATASSTAPETLSSSRPISQNPNSSTLRQSPSTDEHSTDSIPKFDKILKSYEEKISSELKSRVVISKSSGDEISFIWPSWFIYCAAGGAGIVLILIIAAIIYKMKLFKNPIQL